MVSAGVCGRIPGSGIRTYKILTFGGIVRSILVGRCEVEIPHLEIAVYDKVGAGRFGRKIIGGGGWWAGIRGWRRRIVQPDGG